MRMLSALVVAAAVVAGWPQVVAAQSQPWDGSAPAAAVDAPVGEGPAQVTAGEDWATRPLDDGRWAVPLEAIGFGEVQVPEAPGAAVEVDVTSVAVLQPVGLSTEVVSGAHPVEVDILVDGVQVDGFALDADAVRPLVVDLPAGSTSVRFEARRTDDPRCDVPERTGLIRLRHSALLTDGAALHPTDIGAFLRPPIGRVHIEVPADRSPAVDAAVLEAAAILARVAPGLQDVMVGTTAEHDDGPFDRRIRFIERDQAGVKVVDGLLTISGRGTDLADQVRALASEAATLTGVDELVATGGDVDPGTFALGEQVPVASLATRTRVEGAYHLELAIPLDQTAFAAPVRRYDVRLGGIASPPPGDAAQDTQLSLVVDGELEEVVAVQRNGRFDVQFAVEGSAVGRLTTVVLVLDGVRTCGDTSQWTLQVDSGSWVSATGGQSLAPGFERFPQVATAALAVYPGRDLTDLALAATLVARLQEESVRALHVEVVSRDDAIDPRATLIAAGADQDMLEAWAAPVIPGRRLVDGDTALAVDQDDHGLVLQAFSTSRAVDVLAANAGTGSPAVSPDVLAGVRWSELRDAVAVADDDRLVFALGPTDTTSAVTLLDDLRPATDGASRRLFVAGFTIMVTVAVFALAVVRSVAALRRRLERRWAIDAAAVVSESG